MTQPYNPMQYVMPYVPAVNITSDPLQPMQQRSEFEEGRGDKLRAEMQQAQQLAQKREDQFWAAFQDTLQNGSASDIAMMEQEAKRRGYDVRTEAGPSPPGGVATPPASAAPEDKSKGPEVSAVAEVPQGSPAPEALSVPSKAAPVPTWDVTGKKLPKWLVDQEKQDSQQESDSGSGPVPGLTPEEQDTARSLGIGGVSQATPQLPLALAGTGGAPGPGADAVVAQALIRAMGLAASSPGSLPGSGSNPPATGTAAKALMQALSGMPSVSAAAPMAATPGSQNSESRVSIKGPAGIVIHPAASPSASAIQSAIGIPPPAPAEAAEPSGASPVFRVYDSRGNPVMSIDPSALLTDRQKRAGQIFDTYVGPDAKDPELAPYAEKARALAEQLSQSESVDDAAKQAAAQYNADMDRLYKLKTAYIGAQASEYSASHRIDPGARLQKSQDFTISQGIISKFQKAHGLTPQTEATWNDWAQAYQMSASDSSVEQHQAMNLWLRAMSGTRITDSEAARTAGSMGFWQQLQNKINDYVAGGQMTPAFLAEIHQMMGHALQLHEENKLEAGVEAYHDAKKWNLDPEDQASTAAAFGVTPEDVQRWDREHGLGRGSAPSGSQPKLSKSIEDKYKALMQ